MPMTDADTLANAGELWRLVRMVQDTIDKDGKPLLLRWNSPHPPLADLRKLADELDPEYGRH